METTIRSLAGLFLGTALLILGQGLMLGLVPSSMNVRGFSAISVALVGGAYFLGFLVGAWKGAAVIREVGHIRSYGGLIALVIVSVLAMPLVIEVWAWVLLRFLHGFAAGGAFLAIEAWLSGAARSDARGRLLAIYMVITLGGLGGAQLLAGLNAAVSSVPFLIAGILFAASIVPVVLTRIDAPAIHDVPRVSLKDIYRHSPFAFTTSLAAGMCVGAFWTFAPFVARAIGLSVELTGALVATTVFAGLLLQWPAGYASDRYDRRHIVIAFASAGTLAAALLVPFLSADHPALLYACFAVLGGCFCLYPLTMAHAIDHATAPSMALEVSQGLLMANGLGQTLGPLIAGALIGLAGVHGLPLFFAAILGAIVVFSAKRLRVGVPVAPEAQGKHVFLRTTTPAGTGLDPRVTE
jgi:MFS family permease